MKTLLRQKFINHYSLLRGVAKYEAKQSADSTTTGEQIATPPSSARNDDMNITKEDIFHYIYVAAASS